MWTTRSPVSISIASRPAQDVVKAAESTTMLETQEKPAQGAGAACVDAVCAPGQIRTDTGRVLNPLPLPLGYGGVVQGVTLRDGGEGVSGTPGVSG